MPSILADVLVALHFFFVLFVVFGGFLVLKWNRLAWLHVPAAAWGAFIEFSGRVCPLTPLENWLRQMAGARGYQEGFVEHYIIPVLYPGFLTRNVQLLFGAIVIAVNVMLYIVVIRMRGR